MSLAPQDSGVTQFSEVSRAIESPRVAENRVEPSQTGREPGRGEPCRSAGGHGLFALVDAADFEAVSRYSWNATPRSPYARRTVRLGRGRKAKKAAVFLHRLLAGAQLGEIVDHRNGNSLDNRRENLRRTDARGNASNITRSANQKQGGFKGVSWHARAKKWQAGISAGPLKPCGRRARVYLGLFTDPADAARAYDAAARQHFGEFASLNFPIEDCAARTSAFAELRGGSV